MEIRFTRLPGNRCEITVTGRRGPDLRLPPVRVGHALPHDLMHAAVEQSLGLDDGFWGAIERGAALDGASAGEAWRGGNGKGKPVPARGGNGAMEAEIKVNAAYRAWRGLPPRNGRTPAPMSEEELTRACAAIEEAAESWQSTPEGGSLIWHWGALRFRPPPRHHRPDKRQPLDEDRGLTPPAREHTDAPTHFRTLGMTCGGKFGGTRLPATEPGVLKVT